MQMKVELFAQIAFPPLFMDSSSGTDIMFWHGSNVKIRWRITSRCSLTQDKWQLTWRHQEVRSLVALLWCCSKNISCLSWETPHLWAILDTGISHLWKHWDKAEWMSLPVHANSLSPSHLLFLKLMPQQKSRHKMQQKEVKKSQVYWLR